MKESTKYKIVPFGLLVLCLIGTYMSSCSTSYNYANANGRYEIAFCTKKVIKVYDQGKIRKIKNTNNEMYFAMDSLFLLKEFTYWLHP